MYRPISLRSITTILSILFVAASAIAQEQPSERSPMIEVRMYLVVGSDAAAAGNSIPKLLDNSISALQREVSHKNFALLDMQLGRISDGGTVESRGVLDPRESPFPGHPVYSNFQVSDARSGERTGPITLGTVQSGLKIPVRSITGTPGSAAVVTYESIGYVGKRVSVGNGVPTAVGSYSMPAGGGTIYLVLIATRLPN